MPDGLRCPHEAGVLVLDPGDGRGVAERDGEDVHEGGVRRHDQHGSLVPRRLLASDLYPEAEQEESDVPGGCPHRVLEHLPPPGVGLQVAGLREFR